MDYKLRIDNANGKPLNLLKVEHGTDDASAIKAVEDMMRARLVGGVSARLYGEPKAPSVAEWSRMVETDQYVRVDKSEATSSS